MACESREFGGRTGPGGSGLTDFHSAAGASFVDKASGIGYRGSRGGASRGRAVRFGRSPSAPTLLFVIIPEAGRRLYTDEALDSGAARGG
ncbi:hypothetical protein GCM10010384_39640 [Streptomyces djakartensis]|uniref:Uncharacterized protein n=1 Tax=Streptomyces djakartensis TaxID=68193 RepID=A0ABQ2ZXF5_9ACTN|nr:hypothetical protein GCM10010384_39640 [Streptomyces djakartensis]